MLCKATPVREVERVMTSKEENDLLMVSLLIQVVIMVVFTTTMTLLTLFGVLPLDKKDIQQEKTQPRFVSLSIERFDNGGYTFNDLNIRFKHGSTAEICRVDSNNHILNKEGCLVYRFDEGENKTVFHGITVPKGTDEDTTHTLLNRLAPEAMATGKAEWSEDSDILLVGELK